MASNSRRYLGRKDSILYSQVCTSYVSSGIIQYLGHTKATASSFLCSCLVIPHSTTWLQQRNSNKNTGDDGETTTPLFNSTYVSLFYASSCACTTINHRLYSAFSCAYCLRTIPFFRYFLRPCVYRTNRSLTVNKKHKPLPLPPWGYTIPIFFILFPVTVFNHLVSLIPCVSKGYAYRYIKSSVNCGHRQNCLFVWAASLPHINKYECGYTPKGAVLVASYCNFI